MQALSNHCPFENNKEGIKKRYCAISAARSIVFLYTHQVSGPLLIFQVKHAITVQSFHPVSLYYLVDGFT